MGQLRQECGQVRAAVRAGLERGMQRRSRHRVAPGTWVCACLLGHPHSTWTHGTSTGVPQVLTSGPYYGHLPPTLPLSQLWAWLWTVPSVSCTAATTRHLAPGAVRPVCLLFASFRLFVFPSVGAPAWVSVCCEREGTARGAVWLADWLCHLGLCDLAASLPLSLPGLPDCELEVSLAPEWGFSESVCRLSGRDLSPQQE